MSDSRGAPTVFPVGHETLLWLRQGGRPVRAGRWQHFLIGWQSFWFERNLAMQRRLPSPEFPPADPAFILGLWRSGTTFMHDLLSACPGMIYPATWQCMSPSTFRLRVPPVASNAVIRPMDGFTIDAFSPQEDEFALLALGVPSLYRCFFDPRRLPELTCWLNPDAWKHNHPEGWMDIWCEFLAGIADGKPGRLLLKSPNHTFRVRALLERFPKAAYVWVVRDPVEVFFSNRKMWSSMFQRYALWDWNMSDLDRFLQRAFESTAQCLRHASQALPVEKLVVVEFSRLTHAPVITINAVNSRLSFGEWEMFRPAIAEIAARKAAYRADAYDGQQVPSAVIPAIEALREAQQAALASHGF